MEFETLPDPLKNCQRSLQPYIKKRQETAHIRRILASHLDAHVNQQYPLSRPLSLIATASSVEAGSHGVRGIRKEYLRCVRANIKARDEYAMTSKEHQQGHEDPKTRSQFPSRGHGDPDAVMQIFLDLVRNRQRHERLHIIQDYLDMLSQKPAAAPDHLDPNVVLKDVESLPPVPPEVLHATGGHRVSGGDDLDELVGQLEKSVLRAKLLLKREQKLLAKIQAENNTSSVPRGNRLEALGTTRNELINWIETELSRAGESPLESAEPQDPASPGKKGKDYIESQLASIQDQYSRYAKSREALVTAVNGKLAKAPPIDASVETDVFSGKETSGSSNALIHTVYPYLEEMVSVSNEQKAVIQQKSHLTIALAKQLKEGGQGLDRLADESHLLPAHPMPTITTQRKGLGTPISFGDEISSHEKPDSSRRAQAWVFAADSAGIAVRDAISESLEEGGVAILDAQETLLELLGLFGNDIDAGPEDGSISKEGGEGGSRDIWGALNGKLGVIKKGHEDVTDHK